METKLENVRIVRDYDLGGVDTFADVIAFDLNGSASLEYLDDDDTLCAAHDSNLHGYLPTDAANEAREQLSAWLRQHPFDDCYLVAHADGRIEQAA